MKNIIIVSATSGTNLILSKDILNLLDQRKFKAKNEIWRNLNRCICTY